MDCYKKAYSKLVCKVSETIDSLMEILNEVEDDIISENDDANKMSKIFKLINTEKN